MTDEQQYLALMELAEAYSAQAREALAAGDIDRARALHAEVRSRVVAADVVLGRMKKPRSA